MTRSPLRYAVIAGSAAITALFPAALPATAATASAGPPVTRAGQPASPTAAGNNDFFNSDSCTSLTFCMAVGDFNSRRHTPALSELLKAGHWVARPVPSPSHGRDVFANEVSCATPASCLFVGDHSASPQGAETNLAEAWNGSSWRIVTAANPPGFTFSLLTDVACPTVSFCLAVGQAGSGRNGRDTAYTWKNGRTWRRIAVPEPRHSRSSALSGLACFNASNCLAVGNWRNPSGRELAFAARWHDGHWKLLPARSIRGQRSTNFQAVSCPAATRCIAVGNTEDRTRGAFFHAFAEVWSGGKWHISTLRRPPSLFLGVSCPAQNRCFASGYTFPSKGTFAHPLIETWNGRFWTTQHSVETTAPRSGDILPHVSCVSPSHCESVGYSFNPRVNNSDRTLAEWWNGHRWTVQTTANP
ncbi:MAG TPA: hypothetical protein VEV63_02485 [Streptosporangiaceae bacterium]|nr:hypothetical protein [Streptosporangiaceae bacterium]